MDQPKPSREDLKRRLRGHIRNARAGPKQRAVHEANIMNNYRRKTDKVFVCDQHAALKQEFMFSELIYKKFATEVGDV